MKHTQNSGMSWGALLGGVAIGFGLSMLLSPEQKSKAKHKLQSGAEELKKLMTDPAERDRIKDVFGDMTADSRRKYAEIKDSVVSSLQDVKDGWQSIDKDKYLALVNDSLDELRTEQKLTVRQLNKLRKYLESDYQRLKNNVDDSDVLEVIDEERA